MGTAVAVRGSFGGSVERMKAYGRSLTQQAHFGGADADGKTLLNLDKDEGFWKFGQEGEELSEKNLLAINPTSFQHGYVAFGKEGTGMALTIDGEAAQVMVPADFDLPHRDDLPELEPVRFKRGEPEREPDWKLCRSVDLVVVEGPDKGAEFRFAPTSRGGLRFVLKLQAEIGRRLEDEDELCVPLVELFSESYKHRTYGKIWNPLFEIVEWTTLDDAGDEAKPAKHPKKGEKTARGHVVDAREEEEDEKPARGKAGRKSEPKPARAARRGRDEEEEEPEEAPTRGKSRRGRDEEDEKPARTARAARRGRDEDDEEEAPARGAKPARAARRGRDEEDEDEPEEAPRRGGRGKRDEEEPEERGGVRGRRAASGGRTRH